MKASKFTWFPKITATLERVPEQQRAELAWALIQYGTYGTEPDLAWPLDAIFESLREDISNSREARSANRGGRPRKAGREAAAAEPEPRDTETRAREGGNGGSETGKRGFPESGTQTKPSQDKPSQDKPSQSMPGGGGAPAGCDPPTLEEARAYFAANALNGDADAFWAHYQALGWVKGANRLPIVDWGAEALAWSRRQRGIDARQSVRDEADRRRLELYKPPEERAPAEPIPKAANAVDWEAEYAAMGGELS